MPSMHRRLRALKAHLWRVIEWAAVMGTFAWLLAHARTLPARPDGRRRQRANRLHRRPAARLLPTSRRPEIGGGSPVLF